MHISTLAAKDEIAQGRIVAAVRGIAAATGLDVTVEQAETRKQPAVAAMQQREQIADALEAILAHLMQPAAGTLEEAIVEVKPRGRKS
jgi:hypothetical protein